MPVTFVITCRDVKGSKFTMEPGQTRYLRVPADADEIVPGHRPLHDALTGRRACQKR